MACARESDKEEILGVLKDTSVKNLKGAKTKRPSSDAERNLGADVSLFRNVAMPPVIVFNCLLLF